MPAINVRVSAAEHHILVVVARQHGGNLTSAFRALLQKESIMEELRKEFWPLIEAQGKRAAEHEARAEILEKAVARLLEAETKNADNLASIREGLKKVVEFISAKK